jgi:hypothetical protein
MMQAIFSQQNTKRAVAAMLAVWLSGVVFLLCCATPTLAQPESCPLKKTSHCEKSSINENASLSASLASENKSFNCCRFMAQLFDKARKIETNQSLAEAPAKVKISTPQFTRFKTAFPSLSPYKTIVHNRGETYLHNRVFRI